MDTDAARVNMIKQQVRTWDILDERVLTLLKTTPREDFVPTTYRRLAFADMNIPLGHEQVMMSPLVEAKALEKLAIKSQEKILEVGTGSGYMTALLAQSGQHVYSVDIHPAFITSAQQKLAALNIENVTFEEGCAAKGWEKQQPYDAICVTGSLPKIPSSLPKQLTVGGRLFAIVGQGKVMEAMLITRLDESHWDETHLFETYLPPLIHQETQEFNF